MKIRFFFLLPTKAAVLLPPILFSSHKTRGRYENKQQWFLSGPLWKRGKWFMSIITQTFLWRLLCAVSDLTSFELIQVSPQLRTQLSQQQLQQHI